METSRPREHRQRTERDLHGDEGREEHRGPCRGARMRRGGGTRRGRRSRDAARLTTSAPTRCAKWTAIFAIPVIRQHAAEHQREVRDRQTGVGVAHRRADAESGRRRARSWPSRPAAASRRRPGSSPPASQPGEVKSAIATVRQKKISARPACAVETGAGRKNSTVRPPSSALQDHRRRARRRRAASSSAGAPRATARPPGRS